MADLKTKPTKASVGAFLDAVEDDARRQDCLAVLKLMKDVTKSEPRLWGGSMVGFGTYHYRYASGREGDWFVTGFSPRKKDLTLYLMAGFEHSEALLEKLGKFKLGKSCLYVKRLSDIDMKVLKQLVSDSVKHTKQQYG